MSINMSPYGSTLEEQLSSIMDELGKAAVSEITQLFSEGSAALQLQITESREENEALKTRMKVMRSELYSLRLQTRANASRTRPPSRSDLSRGNICKPRTTSLGNGLKPLMVHKVVGHSPFHSPSKSKAASVTSPAEETPDKVEDDMSGCRPAEDCDAFGDRSTQSGATPEVLQVDAPGSSSLSSQNAELRILSVHGQGGRQLVVDGHDTLFTASEVEALKSLPADYSGAKSLDCGGRLDCRKELAVQLKLPIHHPKETPDTILIKDEEDIGGCMPPVEDCNDINDGGTQHVTATDSLHPDGPGSSHTSGANGQLRILRSGEGGGQLVVDNQETLFTTPDLEALSSPSVDHSAAKSLDNGRSDSEMTIHMHTHTSEKPYRCDQCMKGFKRSYNLKTHMKIHSRERPYRCDQCMKGFKRSYDLKIHMRIHSGEKPYRCDLCMKHFRLSFGLKIHMRSHSREMPYRCDLCLKRFRQRCHLKIHMRIHSSEKPYRCDQCMKGFKRSSDLNTHMRIHSREKPYRCDHCTMSFTRSCYLKKHMCIHFTEKSYRCDKCKMDFKQNYDLEIHMRIHSGEKPCICHQCEARFSDPRLLRGHMINAHGQCGALTRVTGTL